MLFADYQGTRLTEGIDTGQIAVPSNAERGGDFSQIPLTGSVNGNVWATYLSQALSEPVTAGEPYSQVFPTGQIPQSLWSAPAKYLLASIPQPNAESAVFETSAEAETLGDDKGALRLDWTHRNGTLTAYYFLDDYSLLQSLSHGHWRSQRARLQRHQQWPGTTDQPGSHHHLWQRGAE